MRVAEQAEELIRTLPGVVSVRVVDDAEGAIQEVHILTTSEITAKQTVRNVESALIAHLGIRIDHRRISVAATTTETPPPPRQTPPTPMPALVRDQDEEEESVRTSRGGQTASQIAKGNGPRRRIYFEDVEIRGSRARGLSCRVVLTKDGQTHIGEARGVDGDRARLELAARAACLAISDADGQERQYGLEGIRHFEAFDRRFVFAGIMIRAGRDCRLLAGTCEVVDSAETAAVLAVLDATNRWLEYDA